MNNSRFTCRRLVITFVPMRCRVSLANVDVDWCFAHRAGTPMMQSFIVLTAQRHTLRPATTSRTRGGALARP